MGPCVRALSEGVLVGAIDGRGTVHAELGERHAVHEEVELFSGPDLVFGCRHVPSGGSVAGVVVCSPLPHRAGATHLPDARLARELARRGVVVQRFHYRGTGHSDGDPAALDLDSMAADTLDAVDHLRASTGVERLGLAGTAAGSVAAALVARELPGAPVALWEPFEPATPTSNLVDLLGSGARPLLVASAGLGPTGGLADDVTWWRSRGFPVDIVPPFDRADGHGVVETTAARFVDRLASGPAWT
jgi:alpha/beta superfamily hydrolase